jgi:tRNA dimethylallyltransferase
VFHIAVNGAKLEKIVLPVAVVDIWVITLPPVKDASVHPPVIVILGPTASGKTRFAARLASETGGEIISADSRQVYRGMDIGTGKDLEDYIVDGQKVPFHLIDIADPGYEYNVYEFQQDFLKACHDILSRGKRPILCGGSGMYLESVIKGYRLPGLPEDPEFLAALESRPMDELLSLYYSVCNPHNTTDTVERWRVIKAIRVAVQSSRVTEHDTHFPDLRFSIFGLRVPREVLRQRITDRLHQRLAAGMVEEVRNLLKGGLSAPALKRFGLEYKFVTMYLEGELNYDEMVRLLNTAIHQFAKRQMTWFRRMEKQGIAINWLDETAPVQARLEAIRRSS